MHGGEMTESEQIDALANGMNRMMGLIEKMTDKVLALEKEATFTGIKEIEVGGKKLFIVCRKPRQAP